METVLETNLKNILLMGRGKVRDLYDLGDRLLVVATDRISAFDVIMPNGIPEKGKILTAMAAYWFQVLESVCVNHLITTSVEEIENLSEEERGILRGRSMVVKKAKPFPVECVARGYLAGSGLKEYQANQTVCGQPLPSDLRNSDSLPEPLFTPATKATSGHDENISFKQMIEILGEDTAVALKKLTLEIYRVASEHVGSKGLILADTKFEFGLLDGEIILIDEVLTPDSSRYWSKAEYEPGRSQNPFDKQLVRDYLEGLDWNKTAPGPELPEDVVKKSREKYIQAYEWITGETWVSVKGIK